jgi:hypothetical protein
MTRTPAIYEHCKGFAFYVIEHLDVADLQTGLPLLRVGARSASGHARLNQRCSRVMP